MTSSRGLGHMKIKWDTALHEEVGLTQCGNGQNIPCDYFGHIKHVGELYQKDPGLPITANADIIGLVGGFGWKLELYGGAPKYLRFEEIEVDPSKPMMLSIAYPKGTNFNIVAHAGWCRQDTAEYSCSHRLHQVESIEEVRSSIGNTYHVDENGVLTIRIIQTPKTFVGRPEFFLPDYNSVGKDGKGYALPRFERNGVRLPKYTRTNYLSLEADCDSADGVYCSDIPLPYEPIVCNPGFRQTGYDICTMQSVMRDESPFPLVESTAPSFSPFSYYRFISTPLLLLFLLWY